MPTRMCAVCRGRFDKSELNRIVKNTDGEICVDKAQTAQCRGTYICRSCVPLAEKKKALERAFRQRVDHCVYERLAAEADIMAEADTDE